MNEIKLSGWVYSKKQVNDKLATFAIKYYAGKDKSGNPINGFMNCKYFGTLPVAEKEKIEVNGWLGFDVWEKDGKKQGRTVICCKEYVVAQPINQTTMPDDDIPFEL